jgi:myo-inositol-1(or 4)-monophosphatase
MTVRHDLVSLLPQLKATLLEAGAGVRAAYGKIEAAQRKPDGTLITRADVEANGVLEAGLRPLLPTAGWLSEESRQDRTHLQSDWVWVVDPLDGTKEFARGIPEFALSVGLVCGDRVAAGAVLNPITGEGGLAVVGGPAEFWGFPPAKALATALDEAVASVSRSETEDGSVQPFLSLVGTTRPVGSVAYKLLRVAAGLEDLTFSVQPKSEWDICGGVGLLASRGLVYQRLDGIPLRFCQPDPRVRSGAVAGPLPLLRSFERPYRRAILLSGRGAS